ncbi:hypothetical protein D8674_010672 [Pyrus ussuriensis x Pyrus communis]|uniref:Uncharacterized protein n=1 Tax=Pyrus ussuriensis x Pyrus communis TaxID=2448454 RepID=A0A5N5FEY9_9ROSA|nr:hypothetical protein D8674_010672 [Pyrus ussuriensis x Pyrus communis]
MYVFEGRDPSIYDTWKEVKPLAEEEFLNYSSDDGHVAYSCSSTHTDGASNFSSTSRASSSSGSFGSDVKDELSKYELQMVLIELNYARKISYAYTKVLDGLKALSFNK